MNSHSITNNRATAVSSFKKTLDGKEGRRSREETVIQLRKNRKDEILRKKRFGVGDHHIPSSTTFSNNISGTTERQKEQQQQHHLPTTTILPLEKMSNVVNVSDIDIAHCMETFHRWFRQSSSTTETSTANTTTTITTMTKNNPNARVSLNDLIVVTRKIRRMLSVQKNPPVQQVLNSGLLFFLIEMLDAKANIGDNINCNSSIEVTTTTGDNSYYGGTNVGDNESLRLLGTLYLEVTWALTNIASTSYTDHIVQFPNAVERIVNLLVFESSPDVREQAAWCLGNIAGHLIAYRDMLLAQPKVCNGFIANILVPESPALLSNVCWSVSNLCRGKPQPPLQAIRPFIHPLFLSIRQSLEMYKNHQQQQEQTYDQQNLSTNQTIDKSAPGITATQLHTMIKDAIWCMSYISDGDNSRIQVVLDDTSPSKYGIACNGSTTKNLFVECLKDVILHCIAQSNDPGLLVPSIRCLGNLVSGTHEQTSIVVDSMILQPIATLLEMFASSKPVKKEICWMLSNIAAGTNDHIDALFQTTTPHQSLFRQKNHGGLVKPLLDIAVSTKEPINVRTEALWALCNIITTSTSESHFHRLIENEVIRPLCDILQYREDGKLLCIVLDALDVILTKNEARNGRYDIIVEEHNGLERIESLQDHACTEVYLKAVSLLERFFNGEEESGFLEDQNIVPNQNEMTFEFSVPKQLFPPDNTITFSNNSGFAIGSNNNHNKDIHHHGRVLFSNNA